jgi:hypothetical protein
MGQKIDSDNLNLARRIAEVKLRPGVSHIAESRTEKSPNTKNRLLKSETVDNLRDFRKSQEARVRNENFLMAKRLAEVNSVDSKAHVLKEIEKFELAREQFKEQNELKKQKISELHVTSYYSGRVATRLPS